MIKYKNMYKLSLCEKGFSNKRGKLNNFIFFVPLIFINVSKLKK